MEVTLTLGPDPEGIRTARLLADRTGASEQDLDVLRVVIAELATNALRHGDPPYTVTVRDEGRGAVTVLVQDGSPDLPALRPLEPRGAGGRGLRIVEGLVEEWGVLRHQDDGKTVWARLGPTP
jgi:anti-sigma regulatory factor (Ser/Thr protein kinase)